MSLNYKLLMKVHGYIAAFYLPLAVLYAATGALYVIGIKGSVEKSVVSVQVAGDWPNTWEEARQFTSTRLTKTGHATSILVMDQRSRDTDYYSWRSMSQEISLSKKSPTEASITIGVNGWYRQMVEIHKDHAGSLFSVLGLSFGIAMLIMVLSGALMILRARPHRRIATISLSVGAITVIIAYIFTIYAG